MRCGGPGIGRCETRSPGRRRSPPSCLPTLSARPGHVCPAGPIISSLDAERRIVLVPRSNHETRRCQEIVGWVSRLWLPSSAGSYLREAPAGFGLDRLAPTLMYRPDLWGKFAQAGMVISSQIIELSRSERARAFARLVGIFCQRVLAESALRSRFGGRAIPTSLHKLRSRC